MLRDDVLRLAREYVQRQCAYMNIEPSDAERTRATQKVVKAIWQLQRAHMKATKRAEKKS
jgi:hypothetical protein